MVSTALIDAPRAPGPVEAVVIGGSAGSVAVLFDLLPGLPPDFPPLLVVVHIPPTSKSLLASLFAPRCALRVREAEAFEPIERGTVYFAPADYHLLVERDRRCSLSIDPPVHYSRPAIDVLFESAADAYGGGLVGVILTGASRDGARGLYAVHERGGQTFVQDPSTAEAGTMPEAARVAVPSAHVVPVSRLLGSLLSVGQAS